uniref:Uncharacterized protein n=1 Tax=Cacopsylla melanoneura TaxID=428564 RepID=A0A8D9ENB4_9HEMI
MNRVAHVLSSPLSPTTSNILPSSPCFLHFVILFLNVHFSHSISSLSDSQYYESYCSWFFVSTFIFTHYIQYSSSILSLFPSFCYSVLKCSFFPTPYLLILTPNIVNRCSCIVSPFVLLPLSDHHCYW